MGGLAGPQQFRTAVAATSGAGTSGRSSPAGRRPAHVTARLVAEPATLTSAVSPCRPGPTGTRCPARCCAPRRATCSGSRSTISWTRPASTGTVWPCATTWTASRASRRPPSPPAAPSPTIHRPRPRHVLLPPARGVQLDRGLYGVLVVDDPAEPGDYDEEWVVVLDDWVDGTGRTPDEVLADLAGGDGTGRTWAHGMGGMGAWRHGSMGGTGEDAVAAARRRRRRRLPTTWSTAECRRPRSA